MIIVIPSDNWKPLSQFILRAAAAAASSAERQLRREEDVCPHSYSAEKAHDEIKLGAPFSDYHSYSVDQEDSDKLSSVVDKIVVS